jgi:hypothetical protein
LPDCWVGAGFVRTAVWDHLHGVPPSKPDGDVDVIGFDPPRAQLEVDQEPEERLRELDSTVSRPVKNQAGMYVWNDDAPHSSETAAAVAARHVRHGDIEIATPSG